jgi:hypothetical protein
LFPYGLDLRGGAARGDDADPAELGDLREPGLLHGRVGRGEVAAVDEDGHRQRVGGRAEHAGQGGGQGGERLRGRGGGLRPDAQR